MVPQVVVCPFLNLAAKVARFGWTLVEVAVYELRAQPFEYESTTSLPDDYQPPA